MFPRPVRRIVGENNRSVFVTGVPRCGSSWVGEILGNCNRTRYVYEPFNDSWMPVIGGHLLHFTYLKDESNAPSLVKDIADIAFQGRQGRKQLVRAAMRGYWGAATRSASKVIVKDPTALLMTEWIAQHHQAQILIVMRHPCGVASSWNALNWPFQVNSLLRQDKLMQDHLGPFEEIIRRAGNDEWLTRGVIWAATHTVFTRQMKTHADWILCKYEDLCDDPLRQFSALAQKLGLDLGKRALKKIQKFSNTDSRDSGSTRKNSKVMASIWQQRMSPAQIDAVMGVVKEFGFEDYEGSI